MTVFNLWRGGINKQYNIQIRNGYTDYTISMVITRLKNPTRLTNLRTIRQTIYIDCISNHYGYKSPLQMKPPIHHHTRAWCWIAG